MTSRTERNSTGWIGLAYVSPRRNRRPAPAAADRPAGSERTESWPDGDWVVRPVAGANSTKLYRCPGCDQEIAPGTPHIVAWPADTIVAGPAERRHWHRPCWERRLRRGASRPGGPSGTRRR